MNADQPHCVVTHSIKAATIDANSAMPGLRIKLLKNTEVIIHKPEVKYLRPSGFRNGLVISYRYVQNKYVTPSAVAITAQVTHSCSVIERNNCGIERLSEKDSGDGFVM